MKTFDEPYLADNFGEPAAGIIKMCILFFFVCLPFFACPVRYIYVCRYEQEHQYRKWPTVPDHDEQRNDDSEQCPQQIIREEVDKLGDIRDRTIKTVDNRPGELIIEITLRQSQQMLIVAVRQL